MEKALENNIGYILFLRYIERCKTTNGGNDRHRQIAKIDFDSYKLPLHSYKPALEIT